MVKNPSEGRAHSVFEIDERIGKDGVRLKGFNYGGGTELFVTSLQRFRLR